MFASTWHDFITAGDAVAFATFLLLLIGIRLVAQGGGTEAVRILRDANAVLADRVHTLELQAKEDSRMIAELRARTDIAVQLQPVIKWTVSHDLRAQERFERTLAVLDRIAHSLEEKEAA